MCEFVVNAKMNFVLAVSAAGVWLRDEVGLKCSPRLMLWLLQYRVLARTRQCYDHVFEFFYVFPCQIYNLSFEIIRWSSKIVTSLVPWMHLWSIAFFCDNFAINISVSVDSCRSWDWATVCQSSIDSNLTDEKLFSLAILKSRGYMYPLGFWNDEWLSGLKCPF